MQARRGRGEREQNRKNSCRRSHASEVLRARHCNCVRTLRAQLPACARTVCCPNVEPVTAGTVPDLLTAWNAKAEARYLADLRPAEVARALRALSSAYVERRHAVPSGLDSTGKRAAFALYYAPLHFVATAHVVQALGAAHRRRRTRSSTWAAAPAPRARRGRMPPAARAQWPASIGTRGPPPRRAGPIARWACAVRRARAMPPSCRACVPGDAIVAAYLLNELARRRAPAPRGSPARGRRARRARARARTDRARGHAVVERDGRAVRRRPAAAPTSGSSRPTCRRQPRCSARPRG